MAKSGGVKNTAKNRPSAISENNRMSFGWPISVSSARVNRSGNPSTCGLRTCFRHCSKVSATCRALSGRSSGFGWCSQPTSRSAHSGASAATVRTGGIGWVAMVRIVSLPSSRFTGGCPVSIANTRLPRLNRSLRKSTGSPRACSGDM